MQGKTETSSSLDWRSATSERGVRQGRVRPERVRTVIRSRREGHHEANRNINRANQGQGQRLEVDTAISAKGYPINQNQGRERESVLDG